MFTFRLTFYASLLLCLLRAAAAEPVRVHRDLEYARVGESALKLDLYLPAESKSAAPVVVWVHGGAWRSGSKENCPLAGLTDRGFAVASANYRLSPVARFPAQVHDLKAAVRFLRANAAKYHLSDKIAITGASAGGHLAALVGVTNGHKELEGSVGEHRAQSSDVQAIVDLYGPTNLTTILTQSTPHGLKVRVPALDLLLGGQPDAQAELARLASPVFHVDPSDPPLLMLHGDQDPQVPINQSHELEAKYEKAGRPVTFLVIHGAAHGGDEFYTAEKLGQIAEYLARCLAPDSLAP
jgi:acetyl esterase/lipase